MITEQVEAARGMPQRVNETITAAGKLEQWVYGPTEYLYFENGRIKTIRGSR